MLGKEQYALFSKVTLRDAKESLRSMKSLIQGDAHSLSKIVSTEWTKFLTPLLINESAELVPSARQVKIWTRKPPGIRAQLVHHSSGSLVQDFLVEHRSNGTHILNAVSPGWTSALPFGRWVAQQAINRAH
jgi:L-2-hydroxyglutarate oxidase LhgO